MLFDEYVVGALVDGFSINRSRRLTGKPRCASLDAIGRDAPGLPEVTRHFFDCPSTNDPMPATPFTRRWPEAAGEASGGYLVSSSLKSSSVRARSILRKYSRH
jgi:hypothetical protein